MVLARLIKLPVVGKIVRAIANSYARQQHGGYSLKAGEAERIIEASVWVAVGECACRKTIHKCDAPVEAEIAVGFGRDVYAESDNKFKEVSKEEAKSLIRKCRESGLISTMMQCRGHYYAICNCCRCCCVPFRLKKDYGVDLAIIRDADIVSSFTTQLAGHAD